MGRSIDKNFEQLHEEEKVKADPINNPAISVPINHVEHEVIPFSIRQYKGLPGTTDQVDMARKLMEDPLMLIKQKEMETRREILQNPVKLKELHKMLKAEQSKKKSKKEKKSKKRRKKTRSDSDSDDIDLDKALAEKYKRLQGALAKDLDSDDELDAGNVDKLLTLKFEALSKELDKMTGAKKKKKRRDSSSSPDDFQVSTKKKNRETSEPKRKLPKSPQWRDDRGGYNDRRRRTPENLRRRSPQKRNFPREDNRMHRSPERYRDDTRNRNSSPHRRPRLDDRPTYHRQKRSRSRSVDKRRNRSPERRKPSWTPRKKSRTPEKRQKSPPEPRNRTRTPLSSDSSPEHQNDDSDDDRPARKTFGLVTSDGKGISIKKAAPRRRSPSPRRDKPSKSSSSVTTKPELPKSRPARMTQDEIDARLKEMMKNASWREKERSEKVNKYRENEKREQEEQSKDFDKDFLTKQLKKTANSTTSVESRIKSNLNNIQRSSRTMESNFARR